MTAVIHKYGTDHNMTMWAATCTLGIRYLKELEKMVVSEHLSHSEAEISLFSLHETALIALIQTAQITLAQYPDPD